MVIQYFKLKENYKKSDYCSFIIDKNNKLCMKELGYNYDI